MVDEVKNILEKLSKSEYWSIDLVQIKHSKKNGIQYNAEELPDFDGDGIHKIVNEIVERYTNGDKSKEYITLEDYDSSMRYGVIYKLDKSNTLVHEAYNVFIEALGNSTKEVDEIQNKYDCYVLKSTIEEEQENEEEKEDISVKIISVRNPVKILKNKFIKRNGRYKEITDKVIDLKISIDILIWKNTIYFFNDSGEKFLDIERAYKKVCNEKISEIEKYDIISDIESFRNIAEHGHNPKKFVSFNQENLEKLNDINTRRNIAEKFNIELDVNNGYKFDTTKKEDAEKLIKVLCGKGKIDPFNEKAVEVYGSKEWR